MADVVANKSLHEIAVERLLGYSPLISRLFAKIQPFQTSVLNTDKELYNLYSKTILSESTKPDRDLLFAATHPELQAANADIAQIVQTVETTLASNSKKELIRDTSLQFREGLNELHTTFLGEFREEDGDDDLKNLRQEYLIHWSGLQSVISEQKVENVWAAYPLFFKRYIAVVSAFDELVARKLDQEYESLGEIEKERLDFDVKKRREKKAKEKELNGFMPLFTPSSGGSLSGNTSSDNSTGQNAGSTQTKTDFLQAKYKSDLDSVRSLIGSMKATDRTMTWEEFKGKYSSNFAVLRDARETDSLIQSLHSEFDAKAHIIGWDKSLPREITPPTRTDIETAQLLVQKATLENGKPLTRQQIDQIVVSLPILPETFLSDLLVQSENLSRRTTIENDGTTKRAQLDELKKEVKRFDTLSALLSDETLQSEKWILEQRLDSVALALQITTVASQDPNQVQKSIQSALNALARTDVNFSLSLQNQQFTKSVVEELTKRVKYLQARSLVTKGKILGSNAFSRSSDPTSFDKTLLLIESMGGSEAAIAILLLTRPELQKKIETLQNVSSGALVLPPSAQQRTPSEPEATGGTAQLSARVSRAEMRLWLIASGKEKYISESEFLNSELGGGKQNKAEIEVLKRMYSQILQSKEYKSTLARRIEILTGALETQRKIAQEYNVNSDTQLLQPLIFTGMAPQEMEAYLQQLFEENASDGGMYAIGMESGLDADDPMLMQDTSGWRSLRYPQADQAQKRQSKNLVGMARNARFFMNPAVLGAVGTGGAILGGAATFAAGVAANAPWVSAAGGAITGGAIGSVVPVIGTTVGAIGGGILGYFGGSALANSINGSGLTLSPGLQTLSQVGNAAANAAPGTFANATGSMGGVGSNVGSTLGNIINNSMTATSNAINGITTISSGINVTGLVAVPITAIGIGAVLINTIGIDGAFIIQGDIATCEKSDGISICKSSDVTQSLNPVNVTYTIEIKADTGKSAVINTVSDTMVVRKSTQGEAPPPPTLSAEARQAIDSLKGKSVDSNTSQKIQYSVNFGGEYADTQILNTIIVGYSANGKGITTNATAQVIFGEVKYGEGCWPTTGTITQGPFASRSHCAIDSIDIFANDEGGPNAPIFSPFDGKAEFFCLDTIPSCQRPYVLPIYGNAVKVTLSGSPGFDGKPRVVIFGHLSQFTEKFKGGDTLDITKGTQLGFMGKSGSGRPGSSGSILDFSEHLHYEYINNTRSCSSQMPPSQLLADGLVPQPVIMGDQWERRVPGTQRVRYDACGSSTSSPGAPEEGKVRGTVSCFSFVDGKKAWEQSELSSYMGEMGKMIALPNVDNALCGDGKTIQIIRHEADATRTDDGCNFDLTGEAGAEWTSASTLQVCDKLFADSVNFGVSTMWHEPGHALKNKRPAAYDLFPDYGPDYLETYPLTKTRAEDFPESFGLCYYNLSRNQNFMTNTSLNATFRGKTVTYDNYKTQCSKIESIVNGIPRAPGSGF